MSFSLETAEGCCCSPILTQEKAAARFLELFLLQAIDAEGIKTQWVRQELAGSRGQQRWQCVAQKPGENRISFPCSRAPAGLVGDPRIK
jgi:hypothetical protein